MLEGVLRLPKNSLIILLICLLCLTSFGGVVQSSIIRGDIQGHETIPFSDGSKSYGDLWTDKGGQGHNVDDGSYRLFENITFYFKFNVRVSGPCLRFIGPYGETSHVCMYLLAEPGEIYDFGPIYFNEERDIGEWTIILDIPSENPNQWVEVDRLRIWITEGHRIWTDKSIYNVGESVIIYVSPTPAIGVGYWLIIHRPDGSQFRVDLSLGQNVTVIQAGPQVGEYKVELWGQMVYPGAEPELLAECYYKVEAGPVKCVGTWGSPDYEWPWGVTTDEDNFYITGTRRDEEDIIVLMKVDSDCKVEWVKGWRAGIQGYGNFGRDIKLKDGYLLVAGYDRLLKFTLDGSLVWSKRIIGGPEGKEVGFEDVALIGDSIYIATHHGGLVKATEREGKLTVDWVLSGVGYHVETYGGFIYAIGGRKIVKLNDNGRVLWSKDLGELISDLAVSEYGVYAVAGNKVIKLSHKGDFIWAIELTLNTVHDLHLTGISVDLALIYVYGYEGKSFEYQRAIAIVMDKEGNFIAGYAINTLDWQQDRWSLDSFIDAVSTDNLIFFTGDIWDEVVGVDELAGQSRRITVNIQDVTPDITRLEYDLRFSNIPGEVVELTGSTSYAGSSDILFAVMRKPSVSVKFRGIIQDAPNQRNILVRVEEVEKSGGILSKGDLVHVDAYCHPECPENTRVDWRLYPARDYVEVYSRNYEMGENGEKLIKVGEPGEYIVRYKVNFSGYWWRVRPWSDERENPGPNFWSSNNVWVDDNGSLHLRISHMNGRWYSAEVYTEEDLGYGVYTWYIIGRIDQLDKNVVLGLFAMNDDRHEVDIEFSKWGKGEKKNGWYTLWYGRGPDQNPERIDQKSFDMRLKGTCSTHWFIATDKYVYFKSVHGHYLPGEETHVISEEEFKINENELRKLPRLEHARAHINLWLVNGTAPSDNSEVEVIISRFEHYPQSKILIVPYEWQDDTQWCWAASASMLLQYYGKRIHHWDIAREFNKGPNDGLVSLPPFIDELEELRKYFREHGLEVYSDEISLLKGTKVPLKTFHLIISAIAHGYPMWLGIAEKPWGLAHAVSVVGYDLTTNSFYIHDPSGAMIEDLCEAGYDERYCKEMLLYVRVDWDDFAEEYDWLDRIVIIRPIGKPQPVNATLELVNVTLELSLAGNGQGRALYTTQLDRGVKWKRYDTEKCYDISRYVPVLLRKNQEVKMNLSYIISNNRREDMTVRIQVRDNEEVVLDDSFFLPYIRNLLESLEYLTFSEAGKHSISVRLIDEEGNVLDEVGPFNFKIITETQHTGDLNYNERCDVGDAILALRIATGLVKPTPEDMALADINGNGKIDIGDAVLILRRATGPG